MAPVPTHFRAARAFLNDAIGTVKDTGEDVIDQTGEAAGAAKDTADVSAN
jgi:hypothetical protein